MEIRDLETREGLELAVSELLDLYEKKSYLDLKNALGTLESIDIALILEELPTDKLPAIYRLLNKETAAEVFVELEPESRERLIGTFTDRELSVILDELYLDDTVDIIEEMPALVVKRIISSSTAENRSAINRLLCYPKDSTGTVMTTEYVRLTQDMTVKAALEHIRKVGVDKETIYTCYVTDDRRHLIGIVSAKCLLLSDHSDVIGNIMDDSFVCATTMEDKESAARKIDKYDLLALPVVDNENRLVGIVTVDDAIDVLKEATTEDIAKMAAITPDVTPYMRTSPFALFKARMPWLLLLMISATVSSTILNFFEASLLPVLLLFVPMLMDTGGNSGSQASVTAIRALSIGEIEVSDLISVIWKEVRVGFLCGLTLATAAFGKIMLVDRLIMNNPSVTVFVAAAVSLALLATILAAKLIGASLPLIAARLKLDPAVMASPLITTIVDAVALILYFFISRELFSLTA